MLNPRPPTSTHIESICSPHIFSIHFHSSTANALAHSTPPFFLSIRTQATPPTSAWGPFVTVEEPFSLFVLQAFPGLFSVDIHTICQWQGKVHISPTSMETSRCLQGRGLLFFLAHAVKNTVITIGSLQPKHIFFHSWQLSWDLVVVVSPLVCSGTSC